MTKAGAEYKNETQKLKIPVGGAASTSAGKLSGCKYVMHAHSPNFVKSQKTFCSLQLHASVLNTLEETKKMEGVKSISIPALACG